MDSKLAHERRSHVARKIWARRLGLAERIPRDFTEYLSSATRKNAELVDSNEFSVSPQDDTSWSKLYTSSTSTQLHVVCKLVKSLYFIIMFPNEIYERILIYCDGQTLLQAKNVNKQWRQIIEYLENKHNIWEQRCKKELSNIIIASMHDKCGYVDGKKKWKVIFHNFFAWQNLKNASYYVLNKVDIDYFENNITCAKISGARIVYANTAGIICVLNEVYEVEDVLITNVLTTAKDIIFLNDVENKDSSVYNHTHMIVVYEKCFFIIKLEAKIRQIFAREFVTHVSVYNNIVAYSEPNGLVRVTRLNPESEDENILEPITFCRIYGPRIIRSLCNFDGNVVIITDNEALCIDYGEEEIPRGCTPKSLHLIPFPYGTVERYWTYYNKIVLCTTFRHLFFSTIKLDGKHSVVRQFDSMKSLQSPICDIYLYTNILLLSTLSGKVFLYVVDDWSEFDLDNYDLVIPVYGEPICSLDIQELENEHRILLTMNDNITQAFVNHEHTSFKL